LVKDAVLTAPPAPAGLGRRFTANVIDAVIVLLLSSPVFVTVMTSVLYTPSAAAMTYPLCFAVYEVVSLGRKGRTLGKRFLKLQVVRDGAAPGGLGFRLAARRCLIKTGQPLLLLLFTVLSRNVVSNITAAYLFIVSLTLLFSPANRGLHDRVAHTQVLYVEPEKRTKVAKKAKSKDGSPVAAKPSAGAAKKKRRAKNKKKRR
jgi:uncharacterized RDD family membrane protein YckC